MDLGTVEITVLTGITAALSAVGGAWIARYKYGSTDKRTMADQVNRVMDLNEKLQARLLDLADNKNLVIDDLQDRNRECASQLEAARRDLNACREARVQDAEQAAKLRVQVQDLRRENVDLQEIADSLESDALGGGDDEEG